MQPRVALGWHGLALAWFACIASALAGLHRADAPITNQLPNIDAYGGPWRFLTFLNLVFQATLCGISLVVDVLMLMKKQRTAKFVLSFRDLLFGSLGLPLSLFVSTSFWTLYIYDRQLVYPKSLDAFIPNWLNHAMHSSVFPVALIELCLIPRRYPSKGKRLALLGIATLSYAAWSLHIYSVTGRWVYPFLGVLNSLGIAVFFLGAFGIAVFYSQMGAFLSRMIWGDTVVLFDSSKKKSK